MEILNTHIIQIQGEINWNKAKVEEQFENIMDAMTSKPVIKKQKQRSASIRLPVLDRIYQKCY